jgi:transposase
VFFDEFGFSFQEPLGRTWAPCGQRPVVKRVTTKRRVLSTAVGLTLSGKIYRHHVQGSFNGLDVIVALKHLQRHLPHRWILIWDRASIHRDKRVKAFLAAHPEISVEWLPSYSPELNPEEYCHGNVKRRLKNATPLTSQEIQPLIDRGFARLRQRPDMILGFFHLAGLSVKKLWLT